MGVITPPHQKIAFKQKINSLCFIGDRLLIGDLSGSAYLYRKDAADNQWGIEATLQEHFCGVTDIIRMSAFTITASEDTSILVWDLDARRPIHRLSTVKKEYCSLLPRWAFKLLCVPSRNLLLALCWGNQILGFAFDDTTDLIEAIAYPTQVGDEKLGAFISCVLLDDDRLLVLTVQNKLLILSLSKGVLECVSDSTPLWFWFNAQAMSANKQQIAIAQGRLLRLLPITIFDRPIEKKQLPVTWGSSAWISVICFHPTQPYLFCGLANGELVQLNQDGTVVACYTGLGHEITSLAVSEDGSLIAADSLFGDVFFWNVALL